MSDETQNEPSEVTGDTPENEVAETTEGVTEAQPDEANSPEETPEGANETVPDAVTSPSVVPSVEAPPAPDPETTQHVALRDFVSRFDYQLLSFKKGDVIDHRVGHALRSMGAPIKVIEKLAEEIQERQ